MSLRSIIKAMIFTPGLAGRWGLPINFWGSPGIGKSFIFEEVCLQFNMPFEAFVLSERGEGALGVVPVPKKIANAESEFKTLIHFIEVYEAAVAKTKGDKDKAIAIAAKETRASSYVGDAGAEMALSFPRPDWTDKFFAAGRGMVFVDEGTSAPPALQPPLMGLMLMGRIGSAVLPPGVRRAMAANPPELAAAGYELPMPLANRMGHIDWIVPTVEEHTQYMLRGSSGHTATSTLLAEMEEDGAIKPGSNSDNDKIVEGAVEVEQTFDAAAEEARVKKHWGEAWARAVGLETAFLGAKTGSKNADMTKLVNTPQAGRAWPSDRTWEMATRAYAGALVHGLTEAETETFVEAFVGNGVASEWFAFIAEQDLPNAARLLDGKDSFKHESSRVDRTVAVLQSCTALVAPKTAVKRQERSNTLWTILEKLAADKTDLDILVPSVQALIECDLASLKHAAKVLAIINPTLRMAGIKPKGSR